MYFMPDKYPRRKLLVFRHPEIKCWLTKEFPENHTGANFAEELEAILDEWKLDKHGLSAVTTDNCSMCHSHT